MCNLFEPEAAFFDEDKYDFGNFPYEMKTDTDGTEITVGFDRRSFAYIELR